MSKTYFEIVYKGPWKGINTSMPEDSIGINESPFMSNFILKSGEIRTRPLQNGNLIPPTPDGLPMLGITSFLDANNVFHTVTVTGRGLYQLNRFWNRNPKSSQKTWQIVGVFPTQPGPNLPLASSVFINKFFWTNGGTNLWYWDGITSINNPAIWKPNTAYVKGSQIVDSNGNLQVAGNSGISKTGAHPVWGNTLGAQTLDSGTTPITWTENGKNLNLSSGFSNAAIVDATNGITAGAYFLIELNAQLLMLNTIESVGGNFPQRIRWCPSGLPFIWDSNVNIGAGFNDELDVPDAITGAFTVGTTAFILRNNGITEVTSNSNSGQNPFNFNHLWASDRGIGNVFPFGYASYGPLGIFIASDNLYNVSMGGFKTIGDDSKDSIYNDLAQATQNPIASIIPYYANNYVYNHYRLAIPQGNNCVMWNYILEKEGSWQREYKTSCNHTGITRWSYTN